MSILSGNINNVVATTYIGLVLMPMGNLRPFVSYPNTDLLPDYTAVRAVCTENCYFLQAFYT